MSKGGMRALDKRERAEVSAAVRAQGRDTLLHMALLRGQTLRQEQ